jgi:hypothetical protein
MYVSAKPERRTIVGGYHLLQTEKQQRQEVSKHVGKCRTHSTLKCVICDFVAPILVLIIITADTNLLLARFTYARVAMHTTIKSVGKGGLHQTYYS